MQTRFKFSRHLTSPCPPIRARIRSGIHLILLQSPSLLHSLLKSSLHLFAHHPNVPVPLLHLDCMVLVAASVVCGDLGKLDAHQRFERRHSGVYIGALQGHLDGLPNHLNRIQLRMGDG